MRLTVKGQVTIPQAIREQLGLMAGTEVTFDIDGDAVRIKKPRARRRPAADGVSRTISAAGAIAGSRRHNSCAS